MDGVKTMKRSIFAAIIISIILISCIVVVNLSINQSPRVLIQTPQLKGIDTSNPQVSLETAYPSSPEKAMVYKTVNGVSDKDLASLQQGFGMQGNFVNQDGKSYYLRDNGLFLNVINASGRTIFVNELREEDRQKDTPDKILSPDENVKSAKNFLLSKHLWENDAIYDRITTDEGGVISVSTGSFTKNYATVTVIFVRSLNGTRVYGDSISVVIGGGGDVIEVYKQWRRIEPYQEMAIIPPEKAFERLTQSGSNLSIDQNKHAHVTSIHLGYESDPPLQDQDYIKPVWFFEGTIENGSDSVEFHEFVPAVQDIK
jgi:hypothetical protein